MALLESVSSHLAWFNAIVLMNKTNLDTTFRKMDIDRLNQELKDNEQGVFEKTEITTM